jgi:hypothetical protein
MVGHELSCNGLVALHAVDDGVHGGGVEGVLEVVEGIASSLRRQGFVVGKVAYDLIHEQLVLGAEVGAEPLVDEIDDCRQRRLLILLQLAGANLARSGERAAVAEAMPRI